MSLTQTRWTNWVKSDWHRIATCRDFSSTGLRDSQFRSLFLSLTLCVHFFAYSMPSSLPLNVGWLVRWVARVRISRQIFLIWFNLNSNIFIVNKCDEKGAVCSSMCICVCSLGNVVFTMGKKRKRTIKIPIS